MGILRDTLKKLKIRAKQSNPPQYGGVNFFGREMTFAASLIIHQSGDEIYVGKNRITVENGFVELSTALDLIIKEYMRVDCIETLTPSAMFNVPIKEELDLAIREVLKKHKIIR